MIKEGASIAIAIVAHTHPFVISVDAHAKTHTLAILAARLGEMVDSAQFPTTPAGLQRAIDWAGRRTGADLDALWVIEGIGSYGARLAHMVVQTGYRVAEAPRMNARANRGVGKSDPLDARRIAAAALPLEATHLRNPRCGDGERAALRVLVAAREHMTTERTGAINALTALLRTIDLGIGARQPLTSAQITEITRWRARAETLAPATARAEAIRLAKRVTALDDELAENRSQMEALVHATPAATLLDEPGIGVVTAAIAMTSWSHIGLLRTEAAIACLAGVNPIPASSGNTARHRLNRGGERRLNRALHMSIVTRMRCDPATRATSNAAEPKDARRKRSADASSATSPDASTGNSTKPHEQRLDRHRRVRMLLIGGGLKGGIHARLAPTSLAVPSMQPLSRCPRVGASSDTSLRATAMSRRGCH